MVGWLGSGGLAAEPQRVLGQPRRGSRCGPVAGAAGAAGAAAEAKAARKRLRKRVPSAELGSAPHVLFLGLAFMADMRLTIDTDAQRLSAEHLVPSNFEPVVFGGPPNPTRVA